MKHGWTKEGRNILSEERRELIRQTLEESPIIIEHWFYYGGRSPDRLIFEDYEEFMNYLSQRARPGDDFHIWNFATLCRDDNTVVNGKYPDEEGCTPIGGAY